MRTPWIPAGEFDPVTRQYKVTLLPPPPEAEAEFRRDEHGRTYRTGWGLRLSCVHCKGDIELAYDQAMHDESLRYPGLVVDHLEKQLGSQMIVKLLKEGVEWEKQARASEAARAEANQKLRVAASELVYERSLVARYERTLRACESKLIKRKHKKDKKRRGW